MTLRSIMGQRALWTLVSVVAVSAMLRSAPTQTNGSRNLIADAPALSVRQLGPEILRQTDAPGVSRGTWGIVVRSLETGETLFAHNPRTLLVPASVAKLLTLAVAADTVGWDFRFETTLRTMGSVTNGVLTGDLFVVGSGDPSIGGRGGEGFVSWIGALRREGITKIAGRIIGDDDALDDPRPGAMWAWDDLGYTSGVLFGALNYADNRLRVTIAPGDAVGRPTTLGVDDIAADRPLGNRSTTGPPRSRAFVWPEQIPGEAVLTIAGALPVDGRPTQLYVSAGNPTRWFAGVFRRELQRAGIPVDGAAYDIDELDPKPVTAGARILYAHRSETLAVLAQPTIKESLNLHSEAMLRATAALTGGRTNDDALAVVRARLGALGIDPEGVQVVDGSGLSRRDGIAAEALVALLARNYDPSMTSPWMTSLPIAGRDGSLEGRLKNTRAENNLRAKTGTMSNIRSLAGYVRTRDDEPLGFAIMVNNFEGTGQQAQSAVDAIAERLANLSRR